MQSGLKIACIGEAMIELAEVSVPGHAKLGVAGDVLNTAIYLRRALGPQHTVSFVSCIGTDALSDQMETYIRSEGLDTSALSRVSSRVPGVYAIHTDAAGERSFTYWREQSAARLLFQSGDSVSFEMLETYDLIYFSGITLAILPEHVRLGFLAWIDRFRLAGGRVAFDSNYRPRLWENREVAAGFVEKAWARADICLPSVDDECALFGDADEQAAMARLRGLGCVAGALKRGASGPLALDPQWRDGMEFLPAAHVVDTTGAGDSFNAGFLAASISGAPLGACLVAGHALAAKVVGHVGAIAKV